MTRAGNAKEIETLEAEVALLRAEVAELRRIVDSIADAIRPRSIDGGQERITTWMHRD